MAQEIRIANGVASVVDITVRYEAPLDTLLATLKTTTPFVSTRLPSGTVMYASNGDKIRYLIERPPGLVHLPGVYADKRLAHPWLYYYFVVGTHGDGVPVGTDESYVYMRPTPLRNLDDLLWSATFPNVYASGDICWGDTITDQRDPIDGINQRINEFFSNDFNVDVELRLPYGMSDYEAWANDLSLANLGSWAHWTNAPSQTTPNRIFGDTATQPTATPFNPPAHFTVARARDWMDQLTDNQLAVLNVALRHTNDHRLASETPA